MYEQHFGLIRHPFTAKATGPDVFVGPQTAAAMASLRKALQSQDAVVAVSGPTGSGKSTIVGKALEAMSQSHRAVRIGRMSLDGADALEFLLEELGVTRLPKGTIRQFAALRDQLQQLQNNGQRLVIIVEDAVLTGAETVAELEALTAADAGPSDGAAIVIMGDARLEKFLQDPQLSRLAQRVRQRNQISPLSAAELRGYLAHCFRNAGNEFDKLFDSTAAVLIHDLCGGNPRMANNIVDAALAAAATAGTNPVSASLIEEVARGQFGLEPSKAPAPEPAASPAPAPDPAPEPVEAGLPAADPVPETPGTENSGPDPIIVFSDEPRDDVHADDDDIPELIQDTLPDLAILAPEFAETPHEPDPVPELQPVPVPEPVLEPGPDSVPEPMLEVEPDPIREPVLEVEPDPIREPVLEVASAPVPEPVLEVEAEPEPEPEPVLEVEPEPEPEPAPEPVLEVQPEPATVSESSGVDVPEWDRDPTMAELRPDLEALEKAMAFAHSDDDDNDEPPVLEPEPEPEPEPEQSIPTIEDIPEITLDNAIQQRIHNELIDEPGSVSPGDEPSAATDSKDLPEVRIPAKSNKKADQELERIAAELAKAKTLEDVDDRLAETLFGEELNLVAAQVVANGPAGQSANDGELSLFDTSAAQMAQAAGTPVASGSPVEGRTPGEEPGLEVSLETPEHGNGAGLDLSASQRLKTVRALNADLHPSLREPGNGHDPGPDVPARDIPTPEPIEDQINTSMTQTLKALNVRPPVSDPDSHDDLDEDDDAEEKRGGFFSRFRR